MIGRVTNVFLKRERGVRVQAPVGDRIRLTEKYGIEEDVNANSISPRHVLIVSSETISSFGLSPGDLKENIVVEGSGIDDLQSGVVLKIGSADVRITFPCEPCSYVAGLGIKNLKDIQGKRGILGVVVSSGEVGVGDAVMVVDQTYQQIPSQFSQRLGRIVEKIPMGKVVTYRQLVTIAGGASSYIRAIPGFIQRNPHLPVHRIVDTEGSLIPHVFNQDQLLRSEGVSVVNMLIDVQKYGWNAEDLFY